MRIARFALIAALFARSTFLHAQTTATSLSIGGDVATPLTLTLDDLSKMPRATATLTEKDAKVTYEGVPLIELLKKAGVPFGKQLRGKNLDSYVVAKAHDGYKVVFTLPELDPDFANESIVLADKKDGSPIASPQGPLRIVCSGDKVGARSERMVESIEWIRLEK